MVRKQLLLETSHYVIAFIVGLFVGYAIVHWFLFINSDGRSIDYESWLLFRPGFISFEIILIKNSQFSVALYLFGFNRSLQYLAMFIAGLISGFLLSPLVPPCAALAVIPHGLLELIGYAVAGIGGYNYFSLHRLTLRDSLVRYLFPSLVLLGIAAFMEAFITLNLVLATPICN